MGGFEQMRYIWCWRWGAVTYTRYLGGSPLKGGVMDKKWQARGRVTYFVLGQVPSTQVKYYCANVAICFLSLCLTHPLQRSVRIVRTRRASLATLGPDQVALGAAYLPVARMSSPP